MYHVRIDFQFSNFTLWDEHSFEIYIYINLHDNIASKRS